MGSARRATPEDAEILAALVEDAVQATITRRGGVLLSHVERSRPSSERVASALNGEGRIGFAGIFDEAVLGVALLHTEASRSGPIAVIDELWVHPEAREVGIGEALVRSGLSWAKDQGAIAVDVEVLPGDREMKNLCERCGLVARTLVMHRSLEDQANQP